MKFELRTNEQTVTQILEKLDRTKHARVDMFQWVAALGKALSAAAYDDLSRSGLQRLLSEDLRSDLFHARQDALGFLSMLEAAEPSIRFYSGFSADEASGDLVLDNLRTYGHTVQEEIARVKKAAFAEADKLKEQLAKERGRE